MYNLAFILLFAKCLFVATTDNQEFSTSEPPSTLDLILSELKENKQQLQNFEKSNKNHLENLERKTREQLQNLEQANRQQLQILEQASKKQFKNLERQINDTKCARQASQFKKPYPINCQQVLKKGNHVSGVYVIRPKSSPEPILVWCDMDSNGRGWTRVLNKVNALLDFDLSWDEYKNGFGNVGTYFWLGLEHLYHLTGFETNELLIKMESTGDFNESKAHYSFFGITSEAQGYRLKSVGGYSGDAGDYLSDLEGMKFSTKDRDQDLNITGNCASDGGGGWWFKNCSIGYPTGEYFSNKMQWEPGVNLWRVQMMVRPTKTITKK